MAESETTPLVNNAVRYTTGELVARGEGGLICDIASKASVVGMLGISAIVLYNTQCAKLHIGDVMDKVDEIKLEMLQALGGHGDLSAGDNLLKKAFEVLTEKYFSKIKPEWENDIQDFINEYETYDKSSIVDKKGISRIKQLQGHMEKV